MAWKTDGTDAHEQAQRSDILLESAQISQVWAGIDMTGPSLAGVQMLNARSSGIHAISIDAANGATAITVRGANVSNSGRAKFAVGGKHNADRPAPATHAVHIMDNMVRNAGASGFGHGQALVASIRQMRSTVQSAYEVLIENTSALNGLGGTDMRFGVRAACRSAMVTCDIKPAGHVEAALQMEIAACHSLQPRPHL